MVIGADLFGRRIRYFSGGAGFTMGSSGGCGGNSVLWIDVEWTCLAETSSEAVSYKTCFATGFLVRDWLVILGNLLLNWSMIFIDAVTPFRHM